MMMRIMITMMADGGDNYCDDDDSDNRDCDKDDNDDSRDCLTVDVLFSLFI